MVTPTPGSSPVPPITLGAFERCEIPLEHWNHSAHVTVAYLLLRAYPAEEATRRMCEGVQRYNAAKDIVQTATGGYHHSMTIAWMRIVRAILAEQGPGGDAAAFLDANPFLRCRTLLRLYYSKDRIMSWECRTAWLEPDLAPLPTART
ncbi:hypothetical protein PHYC_01622 [Phycisphaerales bacterium]|nr:hypothetical protein PHYC_01622 [Phycisphaerales bacterium]